jgi:ABC-type lipoprotein release transport system permease subunit
MLGDLRLLGRIAVRNIFAHFVNLIIGAIVLFGTLFFVVGGSLVSSMDQAMSRSIIGSVAGHAQIYNAASKDKPDLFNGWRPPELEPIADFAPVKQALLQDPNIKAVVPMSISTALVAIGNSLDQALEKLRAAYRKDGRGPRPTPEERASLKAQVRQMVGVIQNDLKKLDAVAAQGAVDPREIADLKRAASDAFWAAFDADPLGSLEFLENRIAYLLPDADQIFLGYVGTDLDAFAQSFDRLQIVDGTRVPPGRRGLLLPKLTYEELFKLKVARRLDKIHEAVTEKGKKIATDPDLKQLVKQNRTQTREIVLQLDPLSLKKAVAFLQKETGSSETDISKLLAVFLDTNDDNFETRYRAFYAGLAPMLELYRMKPGDTMTIKAYTKSGFVQAVNVKIYGTFNFKGLEKSNLAGGLSLLDLMSFRDLYGYITPERLAETQALQKQVGATYVDRENAEDELFGSGTPLVVGARNTAIDDRIPWGGDASGPRAQDLSRRVYSRAEIENGVTMQAALILKDPSDLKATLARVQRISDEQKLGLGVVDWQQAAGNVGQFVMVAKGILFFATAVIFVVALVIMNNAVVMATLQRIREIGTLRAIGAQRRFVRLMVLAETVVLGLAFGSVGAGLGSALVLYLQKSGLPAGNDFLYFFFSGPRLYPSLSAGSLLGAFCVVLVVTCLSALYPALMATRVQPVQAMASED